MENTASEGVDQEHGGICLFYRGVPLSTCDTSRDPVGVYALVEQKALCHDGPEAKVEKEMYQPARAERARGQLPAGCTKQGTVWSQRCTEARVSIVNPSLVAWTGLWEYRPWLSSYTQVRNLDLVHSYSWSWSFSYR